MRFGLMCLAGSTALLSIAGGIYIICWAYQYAVATENAQVARIVKGLSEHESLVNGTMCMLNDTRPYRFGFQVSFDPCTYSQIRSACCSRLKCDSSQFVNCYTHTYPSYTNGHRSTRTTTTCYYFGMACYTSAEYKQNHAWDFMVWFVFLIAFCIAGSVICFHFAKDIHVDGLYRDDECNECISSIVSNSDERSYDTMSTLVRSDGYERENGMSENNLEMGPNTLPYPSAPAQSEIYAVAYEIPRGVSYETHSTPHATALS